MQKKITTISCVVASSYKKTRNVLGEKITYMRRFGWFHRFFTAPNIGESCRDVLAGEELFRKERDEDQSFFLRVFTPENIEQPRRYRYPRQAL